MSKLLVSLAMLAIFVAVPVTTFADTQTFTPPPQKGSVYIVIRHKRSFPPMKTSISIRWGNYSRSGKFDAAEFRYSREGFVIRLDHKKADSIPLTVTTDGTIISIHQGGPPSQQRDKLWEYAEW